jgi:hypothetical protein
MNKFFYLLLFNIFFLALVIFYFNIHLYFKFQKNNDTTNFSEQVMREVQESKTILEESLLKQEGEVATKEKFLDREKEKFIELSRKLSEKVNETLILKDSLRKKKKIETKVDAEMKKEKEKRQKLLEEIDLLKEDNRKLRSRLEQIKKAPAISTLTQGSLPLVREQNKEQESFNRSKPRRSEGVVLSMNPRYNFVVVALGSDDGVELGAVLNVFRKGDLIGRLRVEKLYEQMSSAVILQETFKQGTLAKGDQVRVF